MRFSLKQMVQAALHESQADGMAKIAQEAGETTSCEACGKDAPPGSKFCRECAAKMEKREQASAGTNGPASEEGGEEKTGSARLQKLAAAVEQIAPNIGNLDWSGVSKMAGAPSPKIVGKQPPGSPSAGPGTGSTAMPTDNTKPPGPGIQSEETGEAKTGKPPLNPPMGTAANPKSAPNAMDDNMGDTQKPYPEEGVMKQGGVRALYQHVMLRKAAADAENPASISAPRTQTLTLPENQPSQMKRPPEVTSQERLVASNQAVIDATKRQAKEVPKKRMGEVLSEPAQSAATDKVLDANLGSDVVDRAGAKIASARVLLQKIAAQGCTCEEEGLEKGTCDHCKMKARMEEKEEGQMGKASQVQTAGMPMAGGSMPSPQPVPGGGMSGTGMM